jgi:hypothetical protein
MLAAAACDDDDGGASPAGTPGDPSSGPSAAASSTGGKPSDGENAGTGGSPAPNGGDETAAATAPTPETGSTALSIDADAVTAGTQTQASYAPAAEFEVVVLLDVLAEPAAGYQIAVTWDLAVLSFVAIENAAAVEFPACSPTLSGAGFVSIACLRTDDDLEYTGALARVTLRCTGAGASTLRFRLPAAGVIGTRIESRPVKNFKHELSLAGAEIRCS